MKWDNISRKTKQNQNKNKLFFKGGFPVSDVSFLLKSLFLLFVVIPFVWTLLAKAQLLPFLLYASLAEPFFPAWVGAHPVHHTAIQVLLILYPVLYWGMKIFRWRREEQAARTYLLATARRPHQTLPEEEHVPQYGEDGYDDYWYDR